jgi:drug/metabolite transporter (DMT)-like permease
MKKLLHNGIILAFCTAILSGVSNVVNKIAVTGISDPVVYTTGKNLFVGIMLLFLLFIRRSSIHLSNVKKRDYPKLIGIALIGGAIPFYLYFTALSHIPVINATLIHKSLVFWVALLAIPFLGEKLKLGHFIGIVMIFIANYALGSFVSFSFGKYEWMALLATLCWSVEQIIAKKTLLSIDPDIVSGFRMIGGSCFLVITLFFTGTINQLISLSISQWGMIMVTSMFLLMYVLTWYRALRYNSIITTAVILTSATVVTNLITGVFLTHTAPLIQIQEGSILVLGIVIYLYFLLRHDRTPIQ